MTALEQMLRDAKTVGKWYGTTHGNGFSHDHHCPVARQPVDQGPKSAWKPCTCGWADAEPALERMAQQAALD